MNDFTKEELQEILDLAGVCYRDPLITDSINRKILLKLQSMIDNYCEHEYQESIHNSDIELCIKCSARGEFYR